MFGRLGREPYYPHWGDEKHRQATYSAIQRIWPAWTGAQVWEVVEKILRESSSRSLRAASHGSKAPQPYADAELKVWLRVAREYGAGAAEIEALTAAFKRYRERTRR